MVDKVEPQRVDVCQAGNHDHRFDHLATWPHFRDQSSWCREQMMVPGSLRLKEGTDSEKGDSEKGDSEKGTDSRTEPNDQGSDSGVGSRNQTIKVPTPV